MVMAIQQECHHCPINSDSFQWTTFDINKCKAYQARNVLAKQYFVDESLEGKE